MSGCDDEGAGDGGIAGAAGAGAGGAPSAGSGGTPSAGGAGRGGGGSGGAPSAGAAGQGGGGAGGTPSAGGSDPSGPDTGDPDAGRSDAGNYFDAGGSRGPDAGDAGAPTCDDTTGAIVTCDDLGQLDCAGLEGFLSSECEMLAFNMKPAIADTARSCMLALDPPELCAQSNTYDCIVAALAISCPDPEADDECVTIGNVCGDSELEFNECSTTLSGMTQAGRDQMVQCMTGGTCGLYSCLEQLQL